MTRLLDAGAPPSGPPLLAAGAQSGSGRLSRRDRPAIVGLDCLFPDADGIEPFWDNVLGRRCFRLRRRRRLRLVEPGEHRVDVVLFHRSRCGLWRRRW